MKTGSRIFIAAVIFISMFFVACVGNPVGTPQKTAERADHSDMLTDDRISFTAEYARYTPEDTTFIGILENHGDRTIGYSHCKLERMEDGEWTVVPWNTAYVETLELPTLPGGAEAACGTDLRLYDHTLVPGRYRLVVQYRDLAEYTGDHGRFDHIAFAEFEVMEAPDSAGTVFSDLRDQSLYSAEAAAQGCVVAEAEEVINEEVLNDFLRKALLGMSCEMRIVYPEEQMVRHITARGKSDMGDAYILETVFHGADDKTCDKTVFSYLSTYDGQLVLSNYAYPENAERLGFDVSSNVPVLTLSEDNLEKLRKASESRYVGNGNIMKLYLDDECTRYAGIFFMMSGNVDYEAAERFNIGADSTDAGGTLLGDCYPEGLQPVSMYRISDAAAAFHFTDEEGNPVIMTLDIHDKPMKLVPADIETDSAE